MALHYRDLAAAELDRLREIDRAERITTAYELRDGSVVSRAVDWDVPTWEEGSGEHSVGLLVAFCRGHAAAGARILGCFTTEDRLVGIAIMTPEVEPEVAQLAFLHVSRDWRRQGIATELVWRLASWARETGAGEIYVSATPSESAVSLYRHLGFRVTDRPIPALLELEPEDIHMRRRS